MPRLILASASPQRKTLLEGLGLKFEIIPSGIEENDHVEKDPVKRAADLARLKAKDIAAKNPDAFVIGCDTLVVSSSGELLEKPRDEVDVKRMLALQSGKTSVVHSAVCVASPGGTLFEGVSSSNVAFKALSVPEIEWWIGTGLWKDRSGAFQIDGKGQLMIEKIEGDWTGVVGLPVFLLGKLFGAAKYYMFE